MKKKILIIILLLTTAFAHAQWEVQLDIQNFTYLDRIFFLDENYGWTIGGATIGTGSPYFYTTDGGQNWYLSDDGWELRGTDIVFVNPDTGFIASFNGIIYKTINGGQTWTGVQTPSTQNVVRMFFLDENTGWATLELFIDGHVLKTGDSGESWEMVDTGMDGTQSIYFLDNNNGWLAGWLGEPNNCGVILKSNDGGNSFITQYICSSYTYIEDFYFLSEQIGWAVGTKSTTNSYLILNTEDGGETWEEITLPELQGGWNEEASIIYSIQFVNDTIGWLTCADFDNWGYIFLTTDGGENWQQQFTNLWQPICDIQMLNQDTGWAVGGDFIYFTDNGTYNPVGVEEKQNSDFNFAVSPNPTNGIFTVHFPNEISNEEIIIYDIMEKEVICNQCLTPNSIIDISNQPNGIYFITLKYNTNNQFHSFTKKIIKL